MSLVGPRPQARTEVALYTPRQRQRLLVRPGITGLWQVNDRHNPSFESWIRWDLSYIEAWSAWLDLAILVRTVRLIGTDAWRALRRSPDVAPPRRK